MRRPNPSLPSIFKTDLMSTHYFSPPQHLLKTPLTSPDSHHAYMQQQEFSETWTSFQGKMQVYCEEI